jgi:hypothetical protein
LVGSGFRPQAVASDRRLCATHFASPECAATKQGQARLYARDQAISPEPWKQTAVFEELCCGLAPKVVIGDQLSYVRQVFAIRKSRRLKNTLLSGKE